MKFSYSESVAQHVEQLKWLEMTAKRGWVVGD